jgi:hypothetical protein
MKKYFFFYIRLVILFQIYLIQACNYNGKNSLPSENDIDAARNFIRAALDGSFDKAKNYLLADSLNINYLDVAERSYQKTDPDTRNGYRSSSINIHQVTPLNDSTSIIIFSNSFKNDHDTLRIIKQKDQWLVDLKYLYEHDSDTLFHNFMNKGLIK